MGKIFGIADLPVSTIMSPFEPIQIPQNPYQSGIDIALNNGKTIEKAEDRFVSQSIVKSNPVIKKRNGFGKLMSHFSKKLIK